MSGKSPAYLGLKHNGHSNSPSRNPTPISSPPKARDDAQTGWDMNLKTPSPVPAGLPGLSKENKASEMARRKEERKQVRIFLAHICGRSFNALSANRSLKRTEEERRTDLALYGPVLTLRSS